MAREAPMPPQPPWVWGPSEVNAWIRAAYPSRARPPRGLRGRKASSVRRVRVRILEASLDGVREAVVDGLAAIGCASARGTSHRVTASGRRRQAVASIHHSLLWRGTVVSVRFEPPISRSSSRHLLHLFAKRFRVVDVRAD